MKYLYLIILSVITIGFTACSSSKSMSSSPKKEAPSKSEPVPGAEILIEQEPNDVK